MGACGGKLSNKDPGVTLNNGCKMPVLGYGTVAPWKMQPTDGEIFLNVLNAVELGHRYFDSAPMFRSKEDFDEKIIKCEQDLGNAIRNQPRLKRKDFFISSKCGNTFHSTEKALEGLQMSLQNLGFDYLDLYVIASPCGVQEGGDLAPLDSKGQLIPSDVDYLETWKALESAVDDGLVKSIGVENFNKEQLEKVLANCRIKPAVMILEVNPFYNNRDLIDLCKVKGIHVVAFSPFGAPERPWKNEDDPNLLEDETVLGVAEFFKKNPAQVLLRYVIQQGLGVVVRGTSPTNMEENMKVFDFFLADEHLDLLLGLEKGVMAIYLPELMHHPEYPFRRASEEEARLQQQKDSEERSSRAKTTMIHNQSVEIHPRQKRISSSSAAKKAKKESVKNENAAEVEIADDNLDTSMTMESMDGSYDPED